MNNKIPQPNTRRRGEGARTFERRACRADAQGPVSVDRVSVGTRRYGLFAFAWGAESPACENRERQRIPTLQSLKAYKGCHASRNTFLDPRLKCLKSCLSLNSHPRLFKLNPYPPRRSIGCRKRVVTQIHRPDRPEPPRPRNALAVPSPQAKRPRRAPPPILDETALGRPGRSGALYTACTGFNFALQRQFTRAARRPQAPALPMRHLRVHPLSSPRRLVLRPSPPRDPGRQTRVRCACRAAP